MVVTGPKRNHEVFLVIIDNDDLGCLHIYGQLFHFARFGLPGS